MKYVLPYHYGLIPSEAASNLARYDGMRYGHTDINPAASSDLTPLASKIHETKSKTFGLNVKRRIILGTTLMSQGGGGLSNFN